MENNKKPEFEAYSKDTLQNSLMYLVAFYKQKHTLTSLVNGLPLKKGMLTAQLFTRAAKRAGINAKVVDRKAEQLSPHTLPAVVFLKNQTFAILEEIDLEGNYHVCSMADGLRKTFKGVEEFKTIYGNFAILTKKAVAFEMLRDTFSSSNEWFWGTVKQFKKLYIQVAMAAIMINLLALVAPLFTMNVYDRVVPNGAFETLWVLALGVMLAYTFDFSLKQLRAYFIDTAGKGADILLASRIYEQVLNARLGTRRSSAGAFANQLREFETLRDFFTSSTMVTLIDLPFLFFFILILFFIGGPIALVPLFAVPIVLFVSYFIQLPLQGIVQQATNDMDSKHGHLVETIAGIENIKSLGTQSIAQEKWEGFVGITAKLGTRARFLAQLGLNFSVYIQQIVTVLVVIWGVYRIVDGEMSMGALIACNILVGRTMAPLSQAVALYVRFQQAWVSMQNLNEIMQGEVERPEGKTFVHVKSVKGQMEFKDVAFTYPGAKLDSLTHINFKVSPGEKIGLIGRAGSGKSTISRLMTNLYAPTEGSILVDGLEVRQIEPTELRKYIAYVPQNNMLFRGTLRSNLMLANPDATDAQLLAAAEMSGVIDFARRHPMGFDLPIGEGGEGLSSGQRQAVGVARGILKNGDMVILDDPTSEMDNRSEEWIRQNILKWTKGKTMILITHRAPMLELVDRLIVMDYGKIIADGPKEEVLAVLKGGK